MKKEFRSFEDARKFAQKLELKSGKEWRKFTKSANFPSDIPKYPNEHYENEGWEGMGNWLGTGNTLSKEFRTIEDAKKFVQSLGLKDQKKWREYCISGKKPDDIPHNPDRTYKNEGWKSYGDFLGTGYIATRDRKYTSFVNSRKFAQSIKLQSYTAWRSYCKSGNKPDDIPFSPNHIYKKEWTTWGDFLGTGRIADQKKIFVSFIDARKFARKLNLKNYKEWAKFAKTAKKPENIPALPDQTYVSHGWTTWGYFLGTGNIANTLIAKNYLSFNEAKIKARELAKKYNIKNLKDWEKAVKEGKIPDNMPRNPRYAYAKKREK